MSHEAQNTSLLRDSLKSVNSRSFWEAEQGGFISFLERLVYFPLWIISEEMLFSLCDIATEITSFMNPHPFFSGLPDHPQCHNN